MTNAQVIQFPTRPAPAGSAKPLRGAGPAQLIIFPGVRREGLLLGGAAPPSAALTAPRLDSGFGWER